MTFRPETQVADIATHHPATIAVFQRHGIDFCCGGKRPIEQAAREKDVDLGRLLGELEASAATPAEEEVDWTEAPLPAIVDHILTRYHEKLHADLPRLAAMAKKVESVYGSRHPELAEVRATFQQLQQEMDLHMMKEERILFPLIRDLAAAEPAGVMPDTMHCGSIAAPIQVMEAEHDSAGEALATLRSLTSGFSPPADACNTYKGLYFGLAELEADTHRHVHLENNILFPRASELEGRLGA